MIQTKNFLETGLSTTGLSTTGLRTTGLIGTAIGLDIVFGALILYIIFTAFIMVNLIFAVVLYMIKCTLFILSFFPSLVLAGQSTALAEEIEAKEKELEKQLIEQEENKEERKKVDEQNSWDGDNDSPNEQSSADELAE
jgi:hypothetical protein